MNVWREDKEQRCIAGHERLCGKGTLVVEKRGPTVIRVIDTKTGAYSDWDASAWRVRRIGGQLGAIRSQSGGRE
jgi:hypothetical protein